MPIDPALAPYIPKTLYNPDGGLKVSDSDAAKVAEGVRAQVQDMPEAQAHVFMALMNSTDASQLAPNGHVPDDLDQTLQNLAGVVSGFLAMTVSGNTMDFLARAMIEQYGQQRHEAVVDRQEMRQAAQAELMTSAGKLDEEADKIQTSALTSLIVGVVSAGIQIGMTVGGSMAKIASLKGEMSAMKEFNGAESRFAGLSKDLKAGNEFAADFMKQEKQIMNDAKLAMKQAEVLGTKGGLATGVGSAIGKAGELGANYASSMGQADAKRAEADGKRADALAQGLEAQADLKKAVQEALDDMIKQIIAFVKDQQDAKSERMQAFTRV